MTNDSKLGMLAGVLGVVVAAVFFAKPPAPPVAPEPQAAQPAPVAATPAVPAAAPEAGVAALPSTPVVRKRKDVDAKQVSRAATDEEP